jgi:hypothetical protein
MENEDRLITFLTPCEGPALAIPQLPMSVRPPFLKEQIFPFEKLIEYNQRPVEHYKKIIESLGDDPLIEDIANLLFFSPITNHAVTKLLYSTIFPETFLYTYLSSPIIEFLSFIESLRTLFSRISLPYKRSHLSNLLKMICKVERERCGYLIFDEQGLTHIIASVLFLAIQINMGEKNDIASFTRTIQYHPKLKSISSKFVQSLYDSTKEKPFEISYSFSDPLYEPNLKKSGFITIPKFSSWNKGVCYAELMNYQMFFYKDTSKTKQIGGIPLFNIVFKSPIKGEPENSFTVLTEEMEPAGFIIESKGPVLLTEQLVFKANSAKELESWRSSISHYAFIKMFANMLQLPQWE